MIESKIPELLEFSNKKSKIFNDGSSLIFFKMLRLIMNLRNYSKSFYLIFKCLFFIQILIEIFLFSDITENKEIKQVNSSFYFLILISEILLPDKLINDNNSYFLFFNAIIILTVIYVLIICIIFFSVKQNFVYFVNIIHAFNFFNLIYFDILIVSIQNILLTILVCHKSIHIYLNQECFPIGFTSFYTYLLISLIILIFNYIIIWIFSYYCIDIFPDHDAKPSSRINSNYEVYSNVSKILIFLILFLLRNICTIDNKFILKLFFNFFVLIISLLMFFYILSSVYFYDYTVNFLIVYGWMILIWSTLISILKISLKINETDIFHFIGWMLILFILRLKFQSEDNILYEIQIFNFKRLKQILCYNEQILSIVNRITALGVSQQFQEIINSNHEIKRFYDKFILDTQNIQKFPNKTNLQLFSIVFTVYNYYMEELQVIKNNRTKFNILQEDIYLHFGYFLISRVKNYIFTAYLLWKVKIIKSKNKFLSFMLIEYLKDKLISKFNKIDNTESIKRIQLGVVLSYHHLYELMINTINIEIKYQNEYYTIIKRGFSINQDSEDILSCGDKIFKCKEDIKKIYHNLISLYPSIEAKAYYTFYLESVEQENELIKIENKFYKITEHNFLHNKGIIYKSLFSEQSSIIIADGHEKVGDILYTTPNFYNLFKIFNKSKNLTVHDLVPTAIEKFHYDVVTNGVKFSNLSNIFNKQRKLYLRGKARQLYPVDVFIRSIPEFKLGLNYIISIIKIEEDTSSCNIILNSKFQINGVTNLSLFYFDDNNPIGHFALYAPIIFTFLNYNSKLGGFYFDDTGSESQSMGILYTFEIDILQKFKSQLQSLIHLIMIDIKENSMINTENYNYKKLISEIEFISNGNSIVDYKLITRFFVNKQYQYHRICITKLDNESILENEISNFRYKKPQGFLKIQQNTKNEIEELKSPSNPFKKKESKFDLCFFKKLSFGSASSLSSLSSMNNKEKIHTFNICKNIFSNSNEGNIRPIRRIKMLIIIFIITTIIFSNVYESKEDENLILINTFLTENRVMNKTRIALTRVFSSIINIQNLKKKFISNKKGNIPYMSMLTESIKDLKKCLDDMSLFENDIRESVFKTHKIKLYSNFDNEETEFTTDTYNVLTLIFSMCLKFSNEDVYLNSDNTKLVNFIAEDTLFLIKNFLLNEDFKQIDQSNYVNKFSFYKYFIFNNVILGLNIGFFSFLVFILVYFSYIIYSIEKKFIVQLIHLSNPLFLMHVDNISMLVKKLKAKIDDDNISKINAMDNVFPEENCPEKKIHQTIQDSMGICLKKKDNSFLENKAVGSKIKVFPKVKAKTEKKINKSNIKEKKILIMCKYFKNICVNSVIKTSLLMAITIVYYSLSKFLIQINVDKLFELSNNFDNCEIYFVDNFNLYFKLKNQMDLFQKVSNNTEEIAVSDTTNRTIISFLFDLRNFFNKNNTLVNSLIQLINGDTCQILFSDYPDELSQCINYFNTDLKIKQGIDQAIIHFNNIFLPNFMNYLQILMENNYNMTDIENLYFLNSFNNYETFMNEYFYRAYIYFWNSIIILKDQYIKQVQLQLLYLLICFSCLNSLICFFIIPIINGMRKTFYSLSKFIFIIPSVIILEEKDLSDIIVRLKTFI